MTMEKQVMLTVITKSTVIPELNSQINSAKFKLSLSLGAILSVWIPLQFSQIPPFLQVIFQIFHSVGTLYLILQSSTGFFASFSAPWTSIEFKA